MKRFVHVGFSFTGEPPIDAIEKVFDKAVDWMRYDSHCWILYTALPLNRWRNRLRTIPELSNDSSFLLTESDSHSGYQQTWVWDWFKEHGSQ